MNTNPIGRSKEPIFNSTASSPLKKFNQERAISSLDSSYSSEIGFPSFNTIIKVFKVIIGVVFFPLGLYWIYHALPENQIFNPKQYYANRKSNQEYDLSFTIAEKHPNRTRYGNILPSDNTLVEIEGEKDFFFNANRMLDGRAIASQGPIGDEMRGINELQEFWKIPFDAIFNVANCEERGWVKYSQYWPDLGKKIVLKNGVVLENLSEKVLAQDEEVSICQREISMQQRNGNRKVITQYHLQNWPDHGVVSPEILAKLVRIALDMSNNGSPFLIHCSAGVGRTGTFLAIYEAYQNILKNPKRDKQIFIDQAIDKIRKERNAAMVQTIEQYQLIYDTIQILFKKKPIQ